MLYSVINQNMATTGMFVVYYYMDVYSSSE